MILWKSNKVNNDKFQKEMVKRRKKALRIVGMGDLSFRYYTKLVRDKLKEDIKEGIFKF